jgi:hypothetical protein
MPYGAEQLPGVAHIEDFRPGALVQSYHDGQPSRFQATVTSYPYTVTDLGTESVWVDVEKSYPASEHTDPLRRIGFMSLIDNGVAPGQRGEYLGLYNQLNVAKLVEPAPAGNPALPKSLRELLEQPYANLTDGQKAKVTRYFIGQQAVASIIREERGVPQPPLTYFSVVVQK